MKPRKPLLVMMLIVLWMGLPLSGGGTASAQGGSPFPRTTIPITTATAGQVAELGRLEPGRIDALAWSPDGALLAAAGARGVWLCEAARWEDGPRLLAGSAGPTSSLAFRPIPLTEEGGYLLAAGRLDGTVQLWRLGRGGAAAESLAVLDTRGGPVLSVAFSIWDELAAGSQDGSVRLWAVYEDDGGAVTVEALGVLTGHAGAVTALVYSPDGMALASGSRDGTARLWDYMPGPGPLAELMDVSAATLTGDTGPVESLAFPATLECGTGRALLAAGGQSGAVQVWSVVGRLPAEHLGQAVLEGHAGTVESVTYNPISLDCDYTGQPGILASGGRDGTIRLWDAVQAVSLAVLTGHRGAVTALAFHPDGALLASAGWDGTLRLWGTAEWARPAASR